MRHCRKTPWYTNTVLLNTWTLALQPIAWILAAFINQMHHATVSQLCGFIMVKIT